MALQNGFKILNVQIIDGGGGFAGSTTYTLSFRDRVGNGSDAAGTVTTNSAGKIVTSSISNRGKNYSSGSWEGLANNTGTPAIKGNFTTIGILDAPGSGAVLLPQIGMDTSMSISDINVERGFSATTANSDIHDLYQDFSYVGGHTNFTTSKPNFDWYNGGPVSGAFNQDNVIRFDEFYGTTYDSYGGSGCFALGTPITLINGSTAAIETLSNGDELLSAFIPDVPLDFDQEDTWKTWVGVPKMSGDKYDVQLLNETPISAHVFDIYFDYYDSYYLINNTLKVTWEHPFFVLRNGNYSFKQTQELEIGDKVLNSAFNFTTIQTKVLLNEALETVNLNVEPYDVYFAGNLLVHNVHDKGD